MPKSPEMEENLEAIGLQLFGRSRKDPACVTCGSEDLTFKDDASKREFEISRMCQKCQDEVFG
jgi:hypothetical protein